MKIFEKSWVSVTLLCLFWICCRSKPEAHHGGSESVEMIDSSVVILDHSSNRAKAAQIESNKDKTSKISNSNDEINPGKRQDKESATLSNRNSLSNSSDETSKQPRKRGVISFSKPNHDFGIIPEDTVVMHQFIFSNSGEAPLNIKSTSATCGCTVPSYPFESIQPGGSGYIGVRYNSVGKSGSSSATITVKSDGDPGIMELKIIAEVKEKAN